MSSNSTTKTAFLFFTFLTTISLLSFIFTEQLALSYYIQQPLFLADFNAFKQALNTPGGFIEYAAIFFTELYHFKWAGALSTALLVTIIPFRILTKNFNNKSFGINIIIGAVTFIITTLLISIHEFKISTLLILIGALLINDINLFLSRIKNKLVSLSTILLSVVLTFVLLGGWGLVTLTSFYTISVISNKNYRKSMVAPVILTLILATITPIILIKIKYVLTPLNEAFLGTFWLDDHYKTPLFYSILLSLIVASIPGSKIKLKFNFSAWSVIALAVVTIASIIILPKHTIDSKHLKRVKVDYLAYHKQWNELLSIIDKDLLNDQFVTFQANRAIYHSSSLLENAFSIDQNFRLKGLLLEQEVNRTMLMRASDVYYDLGIINESRHWAHEAFTSLGYQPQILKRLTETNIINGKYKTASKYIRLLKKSPANKTWAKEYELIIKNPALIKEYPELYSKSKKLSTTDYFMNRHMPIQNLANLLTQPGTHKMALEYFITYYLLEHNVAKVLSNVAFFRSYEYTQLPTLVQEALILYMVKTQNKNLDLFGYKIDNQNFKRFNEYSKLYSLHINRDKSATKKLHKDFSESFWYYIHFISPITKSKKK